jgi:hypothetical protein
MARRRSHGTALVVVVMMLVTAAVVGVFVVLRNRGLAPPVAGQQRCVASAGGRSVALDLTQAHYASIIAGLSVKRGLPPRAATIALATVYQETGIRNLEYGDRDSVGLFQQRPSQGWGTKEQLLDPYYATGEFYDALVKVRNWRNRDITEVAQRVQRSGFPEAYRDHEADARVLASVLTGQSPEGLTCLERSGRAGQPRALVRDLRRTFGAVGTERSGATVTIDAARSAEAWAYAHFAVANSRRFGVTEVVVGDRQWRSDPLTLATWTAAPEPLDDETSVRVRLRL